MAYCMFPRAEGLNSFYFKFNMFQIVNCFNYNVTPFNPTIISAVC